MTDTIVARMRRKAERDEPDDELLRLLSAAGLQTYGPFCVPAADEMTRAQIRAWWFLHYDCDAVTKANSAADFQTALRAAQTSLKAFKVEMANKWPEPTAPEGSPPAAPPAAAMDVSEAAPEQSGSDDGATGVPPAAHPAAASTSGPATAPSEPSSGGFRLPTADDVETRKPEDSPELLSAFGEACRIHPGVYVVPEFVQTTLASDPNAVLEGMVDKYPVRQSAEPIVPGEVQWVDGTHEALHYRGNPIKRRKIWAQRGPTSEGYHRYGYTGWQWKVLPATVDVALISELTAMLQKYDAWCDATGAPRPDHYIVTLYEDGTHSIDWHYDKTRDITPGSIITVLKLGEHARPFGLRRRLFRKDSFEYVDPTTAPSETEERKRLEGQLRQQKAAFDKLQADEPVIFNDAVAPGTAIFMTVQANEYTQHAVLPTEAGQTGSIVLRSISTIFDPDDQRIPVREGDAAAPAAASAPPSRKRKR